jgi:hypothetical protein
VRPGLARGFGLAALFALLAAAPVLAGDAFAAPAQPLPEGRLASVPPATLAQLGIYMTPPVAQQTPAWATALDRLGLPVRLSALFTSSRPLTPRVSESTAVRAATARGTAVETELVLVRIRDTESPCHPGTRHCTVRVSDGQLCWAVVVTQVDGSRELVLVDAAGGGEVFAAPVGS